MHIMLILVITAIEEQLTLKGYAFLIEAYHVDFIS